jgi:hypothetical protein
MGSLRKVSVVLAAAAGGVFAQSVNHLNGTPAHPFQTAAHARVFVFVRTDCPISNRYAPELQRIASEFKPSGVDFWLVYSDHAESAANVERQISDYKLPGDPLLDPKQELARRAEASVSPQAAVFDGAGRLTYTGRIDDRYVDFGKARVAAASHDLEDAIKSTLAGTPVPHSHTRAIGCYLADVK